MPEGTDEKLVQLITKDELFWDFWFLFDELRKRQHPDLPRLGVHSIVPDIPELAKIFRYCYEHNDLPLGASLMDITEFGSPLAEKLEIYSETLSKHLLDCFNSAMQKIRIEKHTLRLLEEFPDTEQEPRKLGGAEKRNKVGKQPARFPSPSGLKWDGVNIIVVSDDSLKIEAGGHRETYTYAELGLADKRKVDAATQLWTLIKVLANYQGRIPTKNNLPINISKQLPKHISRLRKVLKDVMQIEDDPFDPYQKGKEYHTRFSIRDGRDIGAIAEQLEKERPSEIKKIFEEDSTPPFRRHT